MARRQESETSRTTTLSNSVELVSDSIQEVKGVVVEEVAAEAAVLSERSFNHKFD